MAIKLQQQLAALNDALAKRVVPKTQDEIFRLTAGALRQALGQSRFLFYLGQSVPTRDPLRLVPCLARQLDLDVFFHNASPKGTRFTFKTRQPYYAPIALASHIIGFLFLERINRPLNELEQQLVVLLATQTAYHLNYLHQMTGLSQEDNPRLLIDRTAHQIWLEGITLQLSTKQVVLLQLLYHHLGHTCSRPLICQRVYPNETATSNGRESRLDMLIFKLRDKLKQIDNNPIRIRTVRGVGYRLEFANRKRKTKER